MVDMLTLEMKTKSQDVGKTCGLRTVHHAAGPDFY